jgi:hypothetical protein
LSYLIPPPLPAPVVVTKDVGGFVSEYQARTEEYRKENREVRLHECRSACTLALSLPNVCVYPSSILKFHLAYNARNHISDYSVSAELFNSYPDAVRARLGTLTREYKIMSGAELIQLGIRDCNEPRIMVASVGKTVQRPVDPDISFSGMMHSVANAWPGTSAGQPPPVPSEPVKVASREAAKPAPSDVVFAAFPLPPARPQELGGTEEEASWKLALAEGKPADVPLPPRRPTTLTLAYTQRLPVLARPRIMPGAAPILPSQTFVALATITER